ncbi:MAG: paraslipin [Deltaproteobacteria bacterium]|nr:MAG: paraslipin [Deltaproteobacteria bacterium]
MSSGLIIFVVLAVFVVIVLVKTAVVVPQRMEFIVERLGKYNKTLGAGFHILVPFLDRIAYRRSLKEVVIDVQSQTCITADNISIAVDGVLYMQVMDSKKSAYGIDNYEIAAAQLAQTSLRSVIGKIELDRTFEERDTLNQQIVAAIDAAATNWGIKVLRYEIKDLTPPQSVMQAMESQMKAVREKRAAIATSEGDRDSRVNRAKGLKEEAIAISEGEMTKQINEAKGKSQEIELVAEATAKGVKMIAEALNAEGGEMAANLRVAEQYVKEFGKLAKESNTMLIPSNMGDMAGMVATAMSIVGETNKSRVAT